MVWTDAMTSAFNTARKTLARAALLCHPNPAAHLAISADASNLAVGAVLEQLINDEWQPLGFFSRTLTPTERRYATFDRELLAARDACVKFLYAIEGRQFTLFSDHKPLVDAMVKQSDLPLARQQRQLAFISSLTMDLQHRSGKANVVADCLSRSFPARSAAATATIAPRDIARAQEEDTELVTLCTSLTSLQLADIEFAPGIYLLCDTSLARP